MKCMLHRTAKSSTRRAREANHGSIEVYTEGWKGWKDGRMEVRVFNGSMEWPFSASVVLVLP